ncbi:MAG: hypothetical protein IT378_24155 [Sandaracinaceae bacterium]|nr:hypothetical protein [Sandaracinaceae bacterium]
MTDLEREAEQFRLRAACEDCAHFDAASERCAHGYPNEEHRAREHALPLVFCKEFELA